VTAHAAFDLVVSHFFTDFDPQSRPRALDRIMRDVILTKYSASETIDVVDKYTRALQELLVTEFNLRYTTGKTLRFTIADKDGEGRIIAGSKSSTNRSQIEFQDLVNTLTPAEFEGLAAYVLSYIGCDVAFRTPQSNDQGLDAFGYRPFLPETSHGTENWIVFLAQAKHYRKAQVGTKDVREFIGAATLAPYKIFSDADAIYTLLELKPFAPSALILITSEEVISSVRRLAEQAGIVLYDSSDLHDMFWPHLQHLAGKRYRLKFLRDLADALPEAF